MPIYDFDGAAYTQIGRIYDNNGAGYTRIGHVYDSNGVTNTPVYTAQVIVLGAQADAGDTGGWGVSLCSNCDILACDNAQISLSSFSTAVGACATNHAVNCTGATCLTVSGRREGDGSACVGIATRRDAQCWGEGWIRYAFLDRSGTCSVDLSGVSGNYYVVVAHCTAENKWERTTLYGIIMT